MKKFCPSGCECSSCGEELNGDMKFCPYCGQKCEKLTEKMAKKRKKRSREGDEKIYLPSIRRQYSHAIKISEEIKRGDHES